VIVDDDGASTASTSLPGYFSESDKITYGFLTAENGTDLKPKPIHRVVVLQPKNA
jgi:hypothetical protein